MRVSPVRTAGRGERRPVGALRAARGRAVDGEVGDGAADAAAAVVSDDPLAFTDGSAFVAAAQPVAPTAVRAKMPDSLVPLVE